MLNLILGRIGSGKTTSVYNRIKKIIQSDSEVVLIVPEQYSFQTEKMMLELLGAFDADKVKIFSFSFLADDILKKYGFNSKAELDDSTRAIMMSLTLESVADKLNVYSRHRYSAAVIAQMLKIIKEFRQCSVSPDMLDETAEKMEPSLLKDKLHEISLIMNAYTAITEQSYFDGECALDKLYSVLREHHEFQGKTVYVDGFRGFTAQELKILEVILSDAEETYITLCTDNNMQASEFSAFAHTNRTVKKLIRIANKNGVNVARPEIIDANKSRYGSQELYALESGLYSDSFNEYSEKTENLIVCSAENFESECEYVAHTVKNLIRTENLRCRDIAIISRSENNYSKQIRTALRKNGVPVFEDKRQPVSSQPLIEFMCSAVDIAVQGFSVDTVMRVLKTGLTALTTDEISQLENYALMWKINGNRWLEEWTAHPDGLGAKIHEYDENRLKEINSIRINAVAPLQKFRLNFKEINGLSAAKAIYKLFEEVKVAENLKKLALKLDERGEHELAIQQSRIWDITIEILDNIASSLENITMTPQRFSELLNLIVSTYTIGNIPQQLDEITIGSADRVKTTAPKVVFAVGVNDGLFPMIPTSDSILSENEKKILADLDLQTDDSFEQKMMEEHFIAYNTLCSASERLFVTYSRKDVSGAQLSKSEIVTQIERIFPDLTVVDTVCTPDIDYIEGTEPAFELMAKLSRKGGKMYSTLKEYFSERDDYSGKLAALDRAINKTPFEISDKALAKELFGMNMYMSASRTEVYHKCPFEYFCKFGMNANPRKVAELDPMQKGTALHYILEKLISAYGSDGLCEMEKEERDKCVMAVLHEYFEDNLGAGDGMGERFEYLFNQLGLVACEVVDRLVSEFSVSEFKPVAFELKIDNDGEVPTYDIKLADGGILKLKGSVDRVDVMQSKEDTFVRVVDYKSGGKAFDLNEVFSGLNMQMLIYLFAIWRSGFRKYRDVKPAGVLYMPVKAPNVSIERDEDEKSVGDKKQKNTKMNGMILDDSRVVYSMDSGCNGRIIPAKLKDGKCSGTLITMKQMGILMKRVEKILAQMAENLHDGKIPVMPAQAVKTSSPYADVCKYCDYHDVCCSDDETPHNVIESLKHEQSLEKLGGEENA